MHQINYSDNNNGKLFLPYWQDARLHDEEKFVVGETFEVLLNGKRLGYAKVVAVKTFRFCNLTPTFSYMVCGFHPAYLAAMLKKYYLHDGPITPDTRFDQVVFHWAEREIEIFEVLLKDWWQKIVNAQPNPLKTDHENIA